MPRASTSSPTRAPRSSLPISAITSTAGTWAGRRGCAAARLGPLIVAARPDRGGRARELYARQLHGHRAGLRRGTVDHHGGDRGGRARGRALRLALYPLPLAPGPHLCGEGAV